MWQRPHDGGLCHPPSDLGKDIMHHLTLNQLARTLRIHPDALAHQMMSSRTSPHYVRDGILYVDLHQTIHWFKRRGVDITPFLSSMNLDLSERHKIRTGPTGAHRVARNPEHESAGDTHHRLAERIPREVIVERLDDDEELEDPLPRRSSAHREMDPDLNNPYDEAELELELEEAEEEDDQQADRSSPRHRRSTRRGRGTRKD